MGYEIFVSLDLDEYLVPGSSSKTVIDELVEWFSVTTRGVVAISKYQFSPVPHILGKVCYSLCFIHSCLSLCV